MNEDELENEVAHPRHLYTVLTKWQTGIWFVYLVSVARRRKHYLSETNYSE